MKPATMTEQPTLPKVAVVHERTVQAAAQHAQQATRARRRRARAASAGDVRISTLHVAGTDLPLAPGLAGELWRTALRLAGGDARRIVRVEDGYVIANSAELARRRAH